MFIFHAFARNPFIDLFILFGEGKLFAALLRKLAVLMEVLDALVAGIGFDGNVGVKSHLGLFKEPEVMPTAIRDSGADDLFGLFVDDNLTLYGMAFLFAGVVALLSFFGRSIGDSEASTKITSKEVSVWCKTFLPGRANCLSLIKVSSTHRHVL